MSDRLLTVDEAADRLGTPTRFVRRLIAERRIAFVRLGERKGCPGPDRGERPDRLRCGRPGGAAASG